MTLLAIAACAGGPTSDWPFKDGDDKGPGAGPIGVPAGALDAGAPTEDAETDGRGEDTAVMDAGAAPTNVGSCPIDAGVPDASDTDAGASDAATIEADANFSDASSDAATAPDATSDAAYSAEGGVSCSP